MQPDIRIGLWGGPSSGKTTYIGALSVAALLDESGEWKIYGQDEAFPGSTIFLAAQTRLLKQGYFPASTTAERFLKYGFKISGVLPRAVVRRLLALLRSRNVRIPPKLLSRLGLTKLVSFTLHVCDYPGGAFTREDYRDELWDYLADCDGLVYLFDPEAEQTAHPNLEYLQQAADFLLQVMEARGKLIEERLPHYLAACISKFDEPAVFRRLREANLITLDMADSGTPYVADARKAFEVLADPLTVRIVERYFHWKRVAYFGTSAIGFYTDDSGKVDIEDCANVLDTPEGKRIRGNIKPINVLAPLIWIERQWRQTRRRHAR